VRAGPRSEGLRLDAKVLRRLGTVQQMVIAHEKTSIAIGVSQHHAVEVKEREVRRKLGETRFRIQPMLNPV
jgi:hypothetical protein